ncbi:isocitrate lyase/phosphoenolpyruvate mutase family protein [Saccharopolyspora hirsuta]|uniref:Isocitrate lyase/phosphoenolpyruvate mutase family protein n=1 Tax=Saccharopolyspora hirsuta TaxID=1837 RepID=A0A5M7C468_SACHI|nr:isocitrate lyase/phosphoenolpyruvate mutase family protein [Saccharopolyspora hirsuta]KAA5836889.1 isocitrate lyase/phosphoenolpyruvate mutase family protein [Saccharopolyspora hirsuta]
MSGEFHALHRAEAPLLLPNAWDFASAAALVAEGFAAIGTTSLGVAAAHGELDGEGCTRAQTVELAARLVELPRPISVDVEAGFGDPGGIAAELAELGVAGINLEDGLGDTAHQEEVIAEVKRRAPDLFLNARTDTYWLGEAPSLEDTIDRVVRYAAAGADGVFVPGMTAVDDIRAVVDAVLVPVNVLFQPGQRIGELAALGVRRVSTGSLLYRAALHGAVTAARAVRDGSPVASGVPGYSAVQDYVGGRRRGSGGFQ